MNYSVKYTFRKKYQTLNITFQFKKFLFLLFSFIFLFITFIKFHSKICLCCIGKNENIYAKEYINHYKNLGYNHIYIYDNNDINGEQFSEVLSKEIKEGFITIIDYRGKKETAQKEAYYHCYRNYNKYYNWLSFFDFDEYLVIKNQSLNRFLNNNLFQKCQTLKINWLNHISDKELLYYEKKPLNIRFNIPNFKDYANIHIKSIVRGNLKFNYWEKYLNPHASENNLISCSSSGKIIDSSSPFCNPPDFKYAFLKHFGRKSFEEYCYKLKRGWPIFINKYIFINDLIKKNINNKQKLKIMRSIFNITNN